VQHGCGKRNPHTNEKKGRQFSKRWWFVCLLGKWSMIEGRENRSNIRKKADNFEKDGDLSAF